MTDNEITKLAEDFCDYWSEDLKNIKSRSQKKQFASFSIITI